MSGKQHFIWFHLDQLHQHDTISDSDHGHIIHQFISEQVKSSRAAWNVAKKRSHTIRQRFLSDCADLMAQKMHTSHEKAIRVILRAEQSRITYRNIRALLCKENSPLTQADNLSSPNDPSFLMSQSQTKWKWRSIFYTTTENNPYSL